MTAVFAFSYAISFAAIAAVIAHTILYHGKLIFGKKIKYRFFMKREKHCKTISIVFER